MVFPFISIFGAAFLFIIAPYLGSVLEPQVYGAVEDADDDDGQEELEQVNMVAHRFLHLSIDPISIFLTCAIMDMTV